MRLFYFCLIDLFTDFLVALLSRSFFLAEAKFIADIVESDRVVDGAHVKQIIKIACQVILIFEVHLCAILTNIYY